MSRYGISLENEYDYRKDQICPLFVDYFGNPELIKVQDINGYTMYMVEINAMLGIEKRYLIVFVSQDSFQLNTKKHLSELNWCSLQTRTFKDGTYVLECESYSYIPRKIPSLSKIIELKFKDERQYVYDVQDLPLKVVLLSKTKGLDYNNRGNLIAAIETYQTIINFT